MAGSEFSTGETGGRDDQIVRVSEGAVDTRIGKPEVEHNVSISERYLIC